jgi:hypothetical protein
MSGPISCESPGMKPVQQDIDWSWSPRSLRSAGPGYVPVGAFLAEWGSGQMLPAGASAIALYPQFTQCQCWTRRQIFWPFEIP